MKRLPFLILTALTLVPLPVAAQGEPPSPPAVVIQFLGFSPEQATRYQQILEAWQTSMKNIQQMMQAQQQELERLSSAEPPDPAAVGEAFLNVRALGRQMGLVVEAYHKNFAAMLNDEQRQRVQAVTQAAQLMPVVQAFVALQLVAPPPPSPK
jgi:uncharacterized membrane protein